MITDKLIERIKSMQNPSVVGLDPRLSYVPENITKRAYDEFGKTTRGAATALLVFNKAIIDAIYDIVPAVKPQVAMYEQFGAEGIDCYIKTIEYAKSKGMIVIGDVKRNDITSTADAYSDGLLGRVDIGGEQVAAYDHDFITINPYLGFDGIEPFLRNCKKYDKGIFVLVKTSNPSGGDIQDVFIESGRPIFEHIGTPVSNKNEDTVGPLFINNGEDTIGAHSFRAFDYVGGKEGDIVGRYSFKASGKTMFEHVGDLVSKWGADTIGEHGFSAIGAVVGATYPAQAAALRKAMPHTFFLVPGYGAQGGGADDIKCCFVKDKVGAVVNSSRGIIAAHQNPKYEKFTKVSFADAARQAAIDMKKDLEGCLYV